MSKQKKWTHEFPIWVSRKNTDGVIAQATVPLWLFLLIFVLVLLNVVLWAGIGLVTAILTIAAAL